MYRLLKDDCAHEMTEPSAVWGKTVGSDWRIVNHWTHCTKCLGTERWQTMLWTGEGPDPRNETKAEEAEVTRKGNEMSKPLYKVAFTGHRPTKIGGYDMRAPMRVKVTEAIKNALARAVAKYGDTHEVVVISGGALGVDTDAAREAHKMGLRFMVAAPCRNQDKKWPGEAKMTYKKMIGFANADLAQTLASNGETVEDGVVYVHDGEYTGAKLMMDRNIWMVDHSDAVVAIWDGSEGGTANCAGYARNQRKPMLIINPKDLA